MGKPHGCILIPGGFIEDGKEAHAAGAGQVLGDWGRLFSFLIFVHIRISCWPCLIRLLHRM